MSVFIEFIEFSTLILRFELNVEDAFAFDLPRHFPKLPLRNCWSATG